MAEECFFLVVYDITSDKRRSKTHKMLLGYGTPVQYSVFECLLSQTSLTELSKRLQKIIKPTMDHVRIYQICRGCQKKIAIYGRSEVTKDVSVLVV